MAEGPLTPELRRFILATLPSVPHLEALLLLRERARSLADVAARLYISDSEAARLTADLAGAGLVRIADGEITFAPAREDLRATVDLLASVYARHVVAVSELIHSTTDRRAFQFADAFRLRKDGP